MPICSVFGCSHRLGKKQKTGVSLHRFPRDEKLKKQWINAVRRVDWNPKQHSVICSEHFEEKYINRTSFCGRIQLRENAIPTIFSTYPAHLQTPKIKSRKPPRLREIAEQSGSSSVSSSDVEEGRRDEPMETSLETSEPFSKDIAVQANDISFEQMHSEKKNLEWQIQELKKKLNEKSYNLKKVKQQNSRLTSRVSSMKSLIAHLRSKNLIDEEFELQIENLPDLHKQLFLQNINKVKKTFPPSIRSFALTVDFYSPKAYKCIRETFNNCLPHPRTLARWYATVDAAPGFCGESLRALESVKEDLVWALVVDEMAIKKKVEWDGLKCMGYVDLGHGIDSDRVAKEAFVFLLTCLNMNLRIPLGYFFVDGISGAQRSMLVTHCLTLLSEKNIKVISLTFDGAVSNISMANHLGCKITKTELQTFFSHNGINMHVIMDPCHMLKLIRNTFGEHKILYDGDGNKIDWVLIKKLSDLQSEEGFHLGNKLKKSHVNYHYQKMSVKLAAQTLSSSVADALEWCKKKTILKVLRI